MYSKKVTVTNKSGLHARPASEFAKKSTGFKSQINIEFKGKIINAKSIIGLLSAGIAAGSDIVITAAGEDEQHAVEALVELIKTNFGE